MLFHESAQRKKTKSRRFWNLWADIAGMGYEEGLTPLFPSPFVTFYEIDDPDLEEQKCPPNISTA
jgi:hypothetical protein